MGAALACLVIVPFAFESYTFHLYTASASSFFTFSGARLWVFLIVEIVFGLVIGLVARTRVIIVAGLVAAAITVLILLFYHLCDIRQCYYSGPDGFAEARLGVLCFAAAITGVMIGSVNVRMIKRNSLDVLLLGTVSAIFLGYHPWALLFSTYMPTSLAVGILAWSALVPFAISGIVGRLLSNRLPYSTYSTLAGWIVLAVMFGSLRPSSSLLLPILLVCAVTASVAAFTGLGKALSQREKILQ